MPTRHEREREQEEQAKRTSRQRLLVAGGIGIVGIGVIAILIAVAAGLISGLPKSADATPISGASASNPTCTPAQSFVSQGQTHIVPGELHPPYNSNPPTSGWHWDTPQNAGIYGSPQVQEQLVHDLEHGFIVIQYNGLTSAETQQLTDIVQKDRYHRLLAPYPQMPAGARVALTAWTKLQNCTGVSEKDIAAFTSAYRDQGPERVP